jgi:hypothetical protein
VSLYPTPTRLDLLHEVLAGNVVEGITEDTDGATWLLDGEGGRRKVTARVEELRGAGWVEQAEAFWHLTSEGYRVLAEGSRT